MSKVQTRFVCQECGAISSKWKGQCDICKAWNSFVEEFVEESSKIDKKIKVADNFFTDLNFDPDNFQVLDLNATQRKATNILELNRVLGGGFVDGEVVLLGGPPGIGKSTLLLQILNHITNIEQYIYVSAEESVNQVIMRAQRLGIKNSGIKIAACSNVHEILASVENVKHNSVIIIDSIQTIFSDLIQSPPGSISQVRFCTQELVNFAKKNDVIVVIVSHITKDGAIAGPKTLEHMVDCVLYFEGEKSYDYRILRGEKNRYGATDEIGVFSMTSEGLVEVLNPSAAFLSEHNDSVSGVAVFCGIEGTRPILLEIQALVSNTSIPMPRRSAVGFDGNRLAMLVAVLSKRCKLNFANKDVYINIAGGLKISEPAADIAVAAAIISSLYNKSLPKGAVFFGEISLSGEIRQSHLAFSRIKEAQKLGFNRVFCSHKTEEVSKQIPEVKISALQSVRDIFSIIE